MNLPELAVLDNITPFNQFIFAVNLVCFLFSRQIMGWFNNGKDIDIKVSIFRVLNILFFVFHAIDVVIVSIGFEYNNYFMKLAYSMAVLYMAMFVFSFMNYLSRKKFGELKTIDDNPVYIDTYNSRLVELILLFIGILLCIYSIIQVWQLDSMLETTGIFGVIIAFLAITNQIWAPDLYFGLVILNSDVLEDGHVIQLEGETDGYIINRLTFIYTVLYNVSNNHRTLIRNSELMKKRIDNLSKRASIDGLRYSATYKIGYPAIHYRRPPSDNDLHHEHDKENDTNKSHSDEEPNNDKTHQAEKSATKTPEMQFEQFQRTIDRMFKESEETLKASDEPKINKNIPFEWALTSTGDFALEYTLYYYLEALPRTKLTKSIRAYIVKTQYLVNEAVYRASIINHLSLSTPVLVDTTSSE